MTQHERFEVIRRGFQRRFAAAMALPSRSRRARPLIVALLSVVAALAACTRDSAPRTSDATLVLGDAMLLDASIAHGVAPMFVAAPNGKRVFAWVTADSGRSTGRLHVMTEGSTTHDLSDAAGDPVLDPETPPKLAFGPDGSLYVLYVVATDPEKPFATQGLRVARSPDTGVTWEVPHAVGGGVVIGGYRNDHGFHVARDGSLYVAWLGTKPTNPDTVYVYASRSADGGRTWSPNVLVDQMRACECCRVALTSDTSATVYAAWRKIYDGNVRDIVVARTTDHGASWSEPVRVHEDAWVSPGCPDAGPAFVGDEHGRLHIAWWTGKEGRAGTHYARSDDAGRTFSAPIELHTAEQSRGAHVQLAVRDDGAVVAAWDDGTLAVPRIGLRVSRDNGATFDSLRFISADGQRARFPVVSLVRDSVAILWHETGPIASTTHAAAAPPRGIWQPYTLARPSRIVARLGRLPR